MAEERNPASVPPSRSEPKFSVYQNPTFSAALTARSLQPSISFLLFISSSAIASALSLFAVSSREERLVKNLTKIHVSLATAVLLVKVLQSVLGLILMATLSALIRALSLRNPSKALACASSSSKKPKEQQNLLTARQLELLGLKPKLAERADTEPVKKPSRSRPISPLPASDVLVPIRKSAFSCTPSRPTHVGSDKLNTSDGNKVALSPISPPPPPPQYLASPSTPWSRHSSGSAKGILTEAMLEQYLADVDEKITESVAKATMTPPTNVRGFGMASPGSASTAATASGPTRSTPLRPVRMSPGSHQKYRTPPKKGEGEFPLPMSMEEAVEAFKNLGIYPHIRLWEDGLRQWFSTFLMNPLVEKIETSHIQVMEAAARVGITISVSQVGSELLSSPVPVNASLFDGAKEWQPTITVDEDGLLQQLQTNLVQARDGSITQLPLAGPQLQQNAFLPVIQQCVDAITEHQRLKTLMKGELVKGLLPQSSVRADYTVQRVRELAEGTCLKNYDYMGNGDGSDKGGKKWTSELPTDSHLLLYLFCAFLEHPKWMLHIDPTSYPGAQSRNPLFLGVLPPKDRFPENYVAVISGVPSVIHPGASILSSGKQSPPVFALYWDKKLQFSLQGRTALWDALLLLCHRIKVAYGGVVRGVHLGSSAFNILPILDSEVEF